VTDEPGETALNAATAAMRAGNTHEAARLVADASAHFRERADADGQMRATNLAGAIAFEHGRLADAERDFGEALEIARRIGDTLMAACPRAAAWSAWRSWMRPPISRAFPIRCARPMCWAPSGGS
jgi:hypothetical protein